MLRAKVNYRKFAWWNTQWAFAGVRDPAHADYSRDAGHDDGRWVFTGDTSNGVGRDEGDSRHPDHRDGRRRRRRFAVVDAGAAARDDAAAGPARARAWNDYGIGLLLQGDLSGAEAAFLKVTRDGSGLRGRLGERRARAAPGGRTSTAPRRCCERALAIDPRAGEDAFLPRHGAQERWASYDEASDHLRTRATSTRAIASCCNQIGRVLFLKRQFEEAIAEFEAGARNRPRGSAGALQPDALLSGPRRRDAAAREQALYGGSRPTNRRRRSPGPYRQLNPHDNNERQPIHEHRTAAGDQPETPSRSAEAVAGSSEPDAARLKPAAGFRSRSRSPRSRCDARL